MIPNVPSNENEETSVVKNQEEAAQEGGESTPVADTQNTAVDAPAQEGEQETVSETAAEDKTEMQAEEAQALPSQEKPLQPSAEVTAKDAPDVLVHDEEDHGDEDEFPTPEEEHHAEAEPSEAEQDALFDNTGDSAQTLLAEIMGDHSNFDSTVEKASPNELVLLMETIADRGKVSDFVQKVMNIKKSFDKKIDEETIETSILSRFNTAFSRFNKKRTVYYAEREKEKEDNSRKKRELLEQLKQIVSDEQVTKIQEVRDIQAKWREVGWVAQKDVQPLNETYRQYLDIFYNLRSKYQELLDLDRKYNLDEKQKVIDEIESLIPTEEGTSRDEWTARSAKVKNLQDVWRTVGLVPRESLEEINGAFRNVLDRFYELRSTYYELQDQQKTENANEKRALLERLAPYATYTSDKAKAWNEATRKVLALQEEWKKIGPGPLDVNKQLWKEYRQICDTFFNNKGEYFKSFDGQRSENLRLKIEICEKAEALVESTDWKETAKTLKDLQEEWKKIGPVHERHSNKVWKRFRKACDSFFERRGQASSAEKTSLDDNLKKKEALITRLEELAASDTAASQIDTFNEIQAEWKATGHVPFKQKDKINNAFKEAIQKYFEKSKVGRHDSGRHHQHQRFETQVANMADGDERTRRFQGEIRKLRIRVQEMETKVTQYEINIQYIAKGKSGETLRNQIQGQIDTERAKIKELRGKIKELQHLHDNPPANEEAQPQAEPASEPVAEVETVEAVETPTEEAPEAPSDPE